MKKKQKQRFQQKLSHHESKNQLSEYAIEHLTTPTSGPLITNDMFAELDSLEFFSEKKLEKFSNRLKKVMLKFPNDFMKIEAGLASYVNSASIYTKELAVLVKSVMNTFDNILLENYENTNEANKQFLNIAYFQSTAWVKDFALVEEDLIQPVALTLYVKRANEITINAMKEWFKFTIKKNGDMMSATCYEEMTVYKGINDPGYYKKLQQKPDVLSAYTGLDDAPFFESELLSSYTLSEDVANKFVSGTINQKGQRRLKVEGHPEILEGRILSSWIVSKTFLKGQYEILCLPNTYTLKTKFGYFNDIAAGFNLEKSS